jgi:hypothetical protein
VIGQQQRKNVIGADQATSETNGPRINSCWPSPPPRETQMPLFTIVTPLIVVGLLLWLVNNYIPMDAAIKRILNVVVIICVVLWLLHLFGLR